MTKFKTNYPAKPHSTDAEIYLLESETIPDQSLTPAEILVRFAQGRGSSVAQYSSEYDDFPDISKLDLEELQFERQELANRMDILETDIKTFRNMKEREKTLEIANKKLAKKQPKNVVEDDE